MKIPTLRLLPVAALVLAGLSTTTLSQAAPVSVLTTASPNELEFGSSGSRGFEFSVDTNVTLTSLGIYDKANTTFDVNFNPIVGTQGDGLMTAHTITLSNLAGDTLASVLISGGTADGAGFIFQTPDAGAGLALSAGTDYVLWTTYTPTDLGHPENGVGDDYNFSFHGFTHPSDVTIVESYFGNTNAFPSPQGANWAFGGPNLQFEAAPEPSTWALLLGGLAALFVVLRRRHSLS